MNQNPRVSKPGMTAQLKKNLPDAIPAKTTKRQIVYSGYSKKRFEQHMKIRVLNRFLLPLRDFLMRLDKTPYKTPAYNQVLKENVKNGFRGSFPSLRIDYNKLILSKGELPNSPALSVCSSKPGKLIFNWTDNSGLKKALPTDSLFISVFNRHSKSWILELRAADRCECYFETDAGRFRNKKVQVYAGFLSADGYRVSTSLFLGEVRVL